MVLNTNLSYSQEMLPLYEVNTIEDVSEIEVTVSYYFMGSMNPKPSMISNYKIDDQGRLINEKHTSNFGISEYQLEYDSSNIYIEAKVTQDDWVKEKYSIVLENKRLSELIMKTNPDYIVKVKYIRDDYKNIIEKHYFLNDSLFLTRKPKIEYTAKFLSEISRLTQSDAKGIGTSHNSFLEVPILNPHEITVDNYETDLVLYSNQEFPKVNFNHTFPTRKKYDIIGDTINIKTFGTEYFTQSTKLLRKDNFIFHSQERNLGDYNFYLRSTSQKGNAFSESKMSSLSNPLIKEHIERTENIDRFETVHINRDNGSIDRSIGLFYNYSYEFDEVGNWIKKNYNSENETKRVVTRKILYRR